MALPTTYRVGAVTVSANGTAVTGTGTNWLAGGIRAGDIFAAKGLTATIESVDSATSLTLSAPWAGSALTASEYEIRYTPDASRVLAASRAALEAMETTYSGNAAAIAQAQLRKNNLTASRAPLPSDDASQGYEPGSRWMHEGREWVRALAGWVLKDTSATPQMFGAAGNGATPDDAAFVAADAADQALRITPPATRYAFSGPVELTGAVDVDGSIPWVDLTDDGKLRWRGEFWPDRGPSSIRRIPGRLFVGDKALDFTGNRMGSQGGFAPTSAEGANWAPRDSALFVAQDRGLMAITGFASNANQNYEGEPGECIGVSGFVINAQPDQSAWALYADVQHEAGARWSAGLELAIKNKGANVKGTPYGLGGGAIGIWAAGGGDDMYGGAPANPSNAAFVVINNRHTWNVGLLFEADGLTGTDGTAGSTGTATAIAMARQQKVVWYEPGTNTEGFALHSSVATAADAWYSVAGARSLSMYRKTDNVLFAQIRDNGAASSDYPVLQNGPGAVSLRGEGASANIDVFLVPKGTGRVRLGTHTAQSDAPITGYIEVKDAGGVLRKLAVIA